MNLFDLLLVGWNYIGDIIGGDAVSIISNLFYLILIFLVIVFIFRIFKGNS